MQNFTIKRDPSGLILRVLIILIISDMIYLMFVLLVTGMRNAVGLDMSLLGMNVLFFFVKTGFQVFTINKILRDWNHVHYYVVDGMLIIDSTNPAIQSTTHKLKGIENIKINAKNTLARLADYGDITINFSDVSKDNQVKLQDISRPKDVAEYLTKASGI